MRHSGEGTWWIAAAVGDSGLVGPAAAVVRRRGVRARRGAGQFSGIYLVTDTGAKLVGRHIDIYVPSRILAKRFGRKLVFVSVLKWKVPRPVDRAAAKAAPHAVKGAGEE